MLAGGWVTIGLLVAAGAQQPTGEERELRGGRPGEWELVLELAASRSPDSHSALVAIAAEDESLGHVALARLILSQWDEKANTFHSRIPMPIRRTRIDKSALEQLFPGTTTSQLALIEVDVSAKGGVPTRVRIVRGPDNKPYRDLLIRSFQESLFCPAKRGDKYVDGTVTITFSLKLR
jgi:hypothetical protein